MTQIILLDTKEKLMECVEKWGGFPDKSHSPHTQLVAVQCRCGYAWAETEFNCIANDGVVCPSCGTGYHPYRKSIPDMANRVHKLFWRAEFYNN